MTKYKCLKSFTSSKGTRYKDGEIVPSYNYNALSYGEQRNFEKVEEFYKGMAIIAITDGIVDTVIDSFSSGSGTSDNSSSSSFDFGGGDSGGAGAGGDY